MVPVQLIPAQLVQAYRQKILNIHPGLLPAFGGKGLYGVRVHKAVIASGARFSGPTVHFVDEEYDTGTILTQAVVRVLPHDSPASLAARVLEQVSGPNSVVRLLSINHNGNVNAQSICPDKGSSRRYKQKALQVLSSLTGLWEHQAASHFNQVEQTGALFRLGLHASLLGVFKWPNVLSEMHIAGACDLPRGSCCTCRWQDHVAGRWCSSYLDSSIVGAA